MVFLRLLSQAGVCTEFCGGQSPEKLLLEKSFWYRIRREDQEGDCWAVNINHLSQHRGYRARNQSSYNRMRLKVTTQPPRNSLSHPSSRGATGHPRGPSAPSGCRAPVHRQTFLWRSRQYSGMGSAIRFHFENTSLPSLFFSIVLFEMVFHL